MRLAGGSAKIRKFPGRRKRWGATFPGRRSRRLPGPGTWGGRNWTKCSNRYLPKSAETARYANTTWCEARDERADTFPRTSMS